MTLHLNCLTVDSSDPFAAARFWSEALGWPIVHEADEEVMIHPTGERTPNVFPVMFYRNADAKTTKNRWHWDLAPEDQDAEVRRLEGLGARRTDIGQGDVPWIVMVDPQGNEFCVLQSLPAAEVAAPEVPPSE